MADPSPETFGKVLADARVARGMTLQQVSASTKISVSKLQAIERDEIESLPGGIFTRGFVRSYAEAVGLDPQETLAQFEARFPEESSVATLHATIEGRANEEFVKRQRTAKGLIWIALLSAPLFVWLVGVVLPDDRQSAEPAAVDDQVRLPADSDEVPVPPAAAVPPAPAPPAAAVPSAPPGDSAVRADALPVVPDDSAALTLQMSATRDCWVQATADGDTVVARILRPGDEAVVVAEEAIDLRIGDAEAFVFTINQRPGRSLGGTGEVVNLRVTPSNYLRFVAQ